MTDCLRQKDQPECLKRRQAARKRRFSLAHRDRFEPSAEYFREIGGIDSSKPDGRGQFSRQSDTSTWQCKIDLLCAVSDFFATFNGRGARGVCKRRSR